MTDIRKQFSDHIQSIGMAHDSFSRSSGTTQKEMHLLEMKRNAALLLHAKEVIELQELISRFEGNLMVAQTVGILSHKDHDDLQDMLKNIKEK